MLSAQQISEHIKGKLYGQNNTIVHWRDVIAAEKGGIAIIKSPRDLNLLESSSAETIIGPPALETYLNLLSNHQTLKSFIIVNSLPINLINELLRFYKVNKYQLDLQENTSTSPNVYIGHNVSIGQGCFFMPGVKIMNGVSIGDNVAIHANTVIKEGTIIGNNVTIDSNCSIGNYAFEYYWQGNQYERIESLGIVRIEDNVEIGSNNTIDRGTFGETIIGMGSKLDNQIQIGHHVKIGKQCLIIAQVGIAGFARIEDKVILHGQVGVAGHVTIGQGTLVKAQAGITKTCPPNSHLAGYPAVDARKFWKKQILLEKQLK